MNDYCPLLSVSMPFIKLPKPMWLYRAKTLPAPRPNLPVDRSPGTGKLIKLGSMPPKAVQQLATLSRLATATRSGSGRPAVSTAGKIVNSPKWTTAFLRHEVHLVYSGVVQHDLRHRKRERRLAICESGSGIADFTEVIIALWVGRRRPKYDGSATKKENRFQRTAGEDSADADNSEVLGEPGFA